MRVAELLAAFVDYEERAGLFDRALLGVRYWHAIRHDVFQESLQALGLAERAHLRVTELPIRSWLPGQVKALPTTLERSLWRDLPRAELLVAAHPRHVLSDGRYICPYAQPLLDATPRSRVVLEGQFQGRYFSPLPDQPHAYVDLALVAAHAEYHLASLLGRGFGARELAQLEDLRAGLERALGAAPPSAALERRARTAVLATRGMTPRFERLLDQVEPRLVLLVIGYRLLNQILTQVARGRGIPVAELQHGALGATHPAYNFGPGRRPASFPDHLLLFGSLWRDATPGLPLPPENTPAIGYAWLELQKARYGRTSPREPKRVLFLSQRSIGPALARVAVELRAICPASSLQITYRLHPSEHQGWREAYPELARAEIDVQAAASEPLYAVQRDSDAQVGVYSTSLLEGLAFGLPTYVVDLPGHEQLGVILDAGLAGLVPDARALAEALRYNASAPPAAARARPEGLWSPTPAASFDAFLVRALAR